MGLNQVYKAFRLGDEVMGAARACAIVFAVHVNDEKGLGWPSLGTIAREAGVSRGTAFKAVRLLEALGVIARVGKRRVGKRKSGQTSAMAAGQTVIVYRWHGRVRTPAPDPSTSGKSSNNYTADGRS